MSTTIVKQSNNGAHVYAVCNLCDWWGFNHSTRVAPAEARRLANRDAARHDYAHENHTGFFHPLRGWTTS